MFKASHKLPETANGWTEEHVRGRGAEIGNGHFNGAKVAVFREQGGHFWLWLDGIHGRERCCIHHHSWRTLAEFFRQVYDGDITWTAEPRGDAYVMLRNAGVINAALPLDAKGRETRKMLIERIMLAYLWGEEQLDSPRITFLFDHGLVDDLQAAAWFLWSIRGETLPDDMVAKIVAFWDRCVTWAQAQPTPPDKFMGTLATLAWTLKDAEGRNGELLLAVAPYAGDDHGTHDFLKALRKLAEVSPSAVAAVVGAMLKTYAATYDYKGLLKSLLSRLAELGQRQLVLRYCEELRQVEGIPELFAQLRAAGQ